MRKSGPLWYLWHCFALWTNHWPKRQVYVFIKLFVELTTKPTPSYFADVDDVHGHAKAETAMIVQSLHKGSCLPSVDSELLLAYLFRLASRFLWAQRLWVLLSIFLGLAIMLDIGSLDVGFIVITWVCVSWDLLLERTLSGFRLKKAIITLSSSLASSRCPFSKERKKTTILKLEG